MEKMNPKHFLELFCKIQIPLSTQPPDRLEPNGWHYWCFLTLMLIIQYCQTLCDSMDCSPPGSSVHGILKTRILEWGAMPFSRGFSWPRDRTQVSTFWPSWIHSSKTSTLWPLPSSILKSLLLKPLHEYVYTLSLKLPQYYCSGQHYFGKDSQHSYHKE